MRARLFREEETLHAPHLLDLEIVHVLRRYCLIGELRPNRAAEALTDLGDLRIVRHPHEPFVRRIWQLRHSITAYDAANVALAEALESPLVTRDGRLASAHGHRARIELIAWPARALWSRISQFHRPLKTKAYGHAIRRTRIAAMLCLLRKFSACESMQRNVVLPNVTENSRND